MLVKEILDRQRNELLGVKLTGSQQTKLRALLEDWGSGPHGIPIFAELACEVDEMMKVSRSEAYAIIGLLEDEEVRGSLYRKFDRITRTPIYPS